MAAGLAVRWGAEASPESGKVINMQAAVAEMLAMALFVTVGCGTACGHGASDGETRLVVAFAFGMSILVLAYTIGHLSGGQINCAVTFSLVLGGQLPWYQGIVNTVFQLIGSVLGALAVAALFPCGRDLTGNLASHVINEDFGVGRAFLGEVIGTFFLCMVVWETAVSPRSGAGANACVAIGFAVFLAHLMLLPIDGCSINPTRSFGTAVVAEMRRGCGTFADGAMRDLWVMWVGPLLGAALAAGVKSLFAPRRLVDEKVGEGAQV